MIQHSGMNHRILGRVLLFWQEPGRPALLLIMQPANMNLKPQPETANPKS